MKLKVRYAVENDVADIVSFARKGFSPQLVNAMLYGCSGIHRYISNQITLSAAISDTVYFVAENEDGVLGFAEFRKLPNILFLNYIGVAENARNLGVAKSLFSSAISMLDAEHLLECHLDVFDTNSTAKSWYEKLGFRKMSESSWFTMPIGVDTDNFEAGVSGYPQALHCFQAFGFSQFSVTTQKNHYSVGMLGEDWFRITQADMLSDKDALACLSRIDGSRNLLGLFTKDFINNAPTNAKAICHSTRMKIDLTILKNNLSLCS